MELKDYGIIISTIDFKENDKIVQIYTKSNGLISAYAFGAKKSKKRFGGNLIPFNLSHFQFKKNKDYFSIEEVTVIKYFPEITKNILNIKILFNVSSLLNSQKGHWELNIFKLLYFLLINLNDAKEDADRLKLYIIFCLYILKKEGVIHNRKECVSCNSKNITYLASDDNSIYFKCNRCKNDLEILTKVDKSFLDFFTQALSPQRSFLEQKFDKNFLIGVQKSLTPFLKRYFNINIEQL